MFGMVAMMGIRILATIDYERQRANVLVAAVSIGVGMIPLLSHAFFAQLPAWTRVVTDSGIVLTTLTAITLNLCFNGVGRQCEAEAEAARNAAMADA